MNALIKISPPEFDVSIHLAYAKPQNFTGEPVYKKHDCYLHPVAAEHLRKAISFAKGMGYKIKIFDAYRPTEAQEKLWEHTPDPDFLAPPTSGSAHSRGVAIDLTLVDANGNELDMGTEFDAFTPLSFHSNLEISSGAQKNRRILLGIMTAAGWDYYENEWWHYQLFHPRAYRLLSDKELGLGMVI